MPILNTRIPDDLSQHLEHLADETDRSKSYYVRKAIEEFLLDYEDSLLAISQLEEKNSRISFDEMVKRLDLED
ncbi:MAG: Ribbon-helix-helix protein copG family [Gammaproteobacteria bacterium]|jgi:RHH-type rel operon transcriptional repressor/antitoxin RelB|nr:Ribbon-helix-helix protein copG family [Gammaproteobacteria bacterium]